MERREFLHQVAGATFLAAVVSGNLFAESPKGGSKVKWQSNLRTAQKLAAQNDKPILIVFGATWCPPCRKLESETFTDKKTVAMIEREFIPVHLDYDKEPKIVKILEVERLPCTIVLSPDADLLHHSEGFAAPKEFQAKLTAALEKRTEIQQVKATDAARR